MKTMKFWRLAFAMLTVFSLASCSSDDNAIDEPTIKTETTKNYTLTIEASKGGEITTRALSLDGTTLNATWAVGEEVSVYSVTGEGYEEMESANPVGTLTAQSNGATTTLKGEFLEGWNTSRPTATMPLPTWLSPTSSRAMSQPQPLRLITSRPS